MKHNNANKPFDTKAGYYTTGAARFTRSKNVNNTALWDSVTLDYADQFSDGTSAPVNYNTYAYPTTVTDPDGFQAKSEYRFDFVAPVKAQGPPPAGQSVGALGRVDDTIALLARLTPAGMPLLS